MSNQIQNSKHLTNIITTTYPTADIYLVGGSMRDKLLKRKITDFDIVVTNVPAKQLENLLKTYGMVKLVGKSFGVYKWKPHFRKKVKDMPEIDIALPRKETGWGTGKRRDFTIQADHKLTIEEDLSRRDFTINAIAYNVKSRRYIDPFHGRDDVQKKIIKTVGKPEERFQEDASRILRAIRFACQLNFTIHKTTWQAVTKHISSIKKVTKEIAAKEIVKAFSYNPIYAADLFEKAGIAALLMPELLEMKRCRQPKKWHREGNVLKHTKLALSKLMSMYQAPYDSTLVFAILLHDIGKPQVKAKTEERITFYGHDKKGAQIARRIIKRLKLESAGVNLEHVQWLIKNHMIVFNSDTAKMKNTTIEKYFLSDRYPSHHLLTLIECDALATIPEDKTRDNIYGLNVIKKRIALIKKKPKKPLLNGDEIMALLGIPPGKEVGKIMARLREAELEGKISTKEKAKLFLKQSSGR